MAAGSISKCPRIAVICTSRNAATTISDSIASVIDQTFEQWEMVIVDDGSDDLTPECVKSFAEIDPRIKLIATEGIGRAPSLNLAVSRASAPLIANLDADDCFHPRHLEVLETFCQERPEFSVYCARTVIFGKGQRPNWPRQPVDYAIESLGAEDITNQLVSRNPVCHSSVLFAKKTIETMKGYDTNLVSQIDYDLWIRVIAHGGRIGRISFPLVAKRIHPDQSYEARKRLTYLINSAKTQARAIRLLGGHWYHWIFLALRFLWGLRPRRTLRNLLRVDG